MPWFPLCQALREWLDGWGSSQPLALLGHSPFSAARVSLQAATTEPPNWVGRSWLSGSCNVGRVLVGCKTLKAFKAYLRSVSHPLARLEVWHW